MKSSHPSGKLSTLEKLQKSRQRLTELPRLPVAGFIEKVKQLFKSPALPKTLERFKLTKVKQPVVMLLASVAFVMLLIVLKVITHTSFVKLPSLTEQSAGIQVFDRSDKLVCVVQEHGDRKPVPLKDVSPFLRQAVVAIEDHNFYHHVGIDPLGIARALYVNAKAHQMVEGGSTITQQLMKTMYFGYEDRTARRKILEMFMAFDVETCYSKDAILETYLNQVYFGRGAYGIERAAETYFNKPAGKLTLFESAFLAGLIKAPSELGAPGNLKRAQARQQEVLNSMVECGFISQDKAKLAKADRLNFKAGQHSLVYPYYVSYVLGLVKHEVGEGNLWREPLKVYTNLDTSAQSAAQRALDAGVKRAPLGIDQGALVSIRVDDGAVIAMVGGVGSYEQHQWNRAVNPHTAGSAFKPFVYLAGLMNGVIGPNSTIDDAPVAVQNGNGTIYTPRNYDGQYKGLLTIREAIALSRNVCAVKVAQDAGLNNVIDTARKAGITAKMDPYPSLALGTCAITPLQMSNAYATLARGGEYMEPQFIRHIDRSDGRTIKSFHSSGEFRLPSEQVYELVDCLQDVVRVGTGKKAYLAGIAVAGKTGTADESKDVWFTGFTPDVVTAVWAGNDENHPIYRRGITGGTVAAGMWSNYMSNYYKSHPKPTVAFVEPAQPLTRNVPFFTSIPQAFGEAVNQFGASFASELQPLGDKGVKTDKVHKGGFFRRLADRFKHWF